MFGIMNAGSRVVMDEKTLFANDRPTWLCLLKALAE